MRKILLALSVFIFCFSISASAQNGPQAAITKPSPLIILNEEGKSFEFTAADLAKLSRQQIKAKDHDGKEILFEGGSVAEVLKLAGVKLGGDTMRGKRVA